jgi:hypothetical protein
MQHCAAVGLAIDCQWVVAVAAKLRLGRPQLLGSSTSDYGRLPDLTSAGGPSHLRVAMQLERQKCLMRQPIVRALSAQVDPCLPANYRVLPAISPTSQISARRHWPKLAHWLLQRESHSSRAGVPWRSSPRQRITRIVTCNLSAHRHTHAAPPSGCDLVHASDSSGLVEALRALSSMASCEPWFIGARLHHRLSRPAPTG